MNDRSKRRELRYNLTCRISKLEIMNCEGCPNKSRVDKIDRNACKDCPVFKQLVSLGDELLSLSVRDSKEKIIEVYEPVKKVRIRKQSKSTKDIKPLMRHPWNEKEKA